MNIFSKSYLLFSVLFLVIIQFKVSAQVNHLAENVAYKAGPKGKKPTNESVSLITTDFIYTTGTELRDLFIGKYNAKSLENIWLVKTKRQLSIKGAFLNFIYAKVTPDGNTHLIFEGIIRKDEGHLLLDVTYDADGIEIGKSVLCKSQAISDNDVSVSFSRNSSNKYFVFRTLTNLVNSKYKVALNVFWFDNNLKLINQKSEELNFSICDFAYQDELLDTNTGDFYISYRNLNSEVFGDENYLHKIYFTDKTSIVKQIPFKEIKVIRNYLGINYQLNQVNLHGFGGIKTDNKSDRIFFYALNTNTLEIKQTHTFPISEALVENIVDAKNLDQKLSTKNKSANYELMDYFELPDKSSVFIYEDNMASTYSSLLLFCYDKNNQLKWSRFVAKQGYFYGFSSDGRKGGFMRFTDGNTIKIYTETNASYMNKRYDNLKGLDKNGLNYRCFIEISINDYGEAKVVNLITHKVHSDISFISFGSFYANRNPETFFFTSYYTGGGKYSKPNLVKAMVKEKIN